MRKRGYKYFAAFGLSAALIFGCSSLAFADTNGYVVTNGATANVRTQPSTDSDSITSLSNGETVQIVGTSGNWTEIRINGTTGYIQSNLVAEGTPSTSTTSTSSTTGTTGTTTSSTTGTTSSSTTDGASTTSTDENSDTSEDGTSVTVGTASYTLTSDFSDDDIPSGFTKVDVTYNGSTYSGVRNESMGMTLLYLENSSGTGAFFVYDQDSSSFSPFILVGGDEHYIVLEALPTDFTLPEGYTSATLSVDSTGTIGGIQSEDSDVSDVYYVYAMDNDGSEGWYLYDQKDSSFVRASEPQAVTTTESTAATASSDASSTVGGKLTSLLKKQYSRVIAILIGIVVVLLIIIINLLLWYRKGDDAEEEYDDDYYDDDEEEEIPVKAKKSRKRAQEEEDEDEEPIHSAVKEAKRENSRGRKAVRREVEEGYPEDEDYLDNEEYLDDEEEDEPVPRPQPARKPAQRQQPAEESTVLEAQDEDDEDEDDDLDFIDLDDL